MTKSEIQELIQEAGCFACFTGGSLQDLLKLALLARISSDGQRVSTWSLGTQVSLTGTTNATTLWSFTLPGGILGRNGFLRWTYMASAGANNANAKTIHTNLGGSMIGTNLTVASAISNNAFRMLHCRNSHTAKIWPFNNQTAMPFSQSSVGPSLVNINTEIDQTFSLVGTLANGADTINLEAAFVEAFYLP